MLEVTDKFRPRTERALIERVVTAVCEFVGRDEFEVSLLLTDDAEMAELHGQFLGDPTPTDVMSFEMGDGAEIVVSVETATRMARASGHEVTAEVALYIVHGMLHTLGYDDIDDDDRRRMREAERTIMARLQLDVRAVDS
jgi:probable rRNA maturation factor